MKKLLLSCFSAMLLLTSCTSDNTDQNAADPTIIAAVHFENGDRFVFDNTGQLQSIYLSLWNKELQYEFNSNDQITEISETNFTTGITTSYAITYDANEHITTLGDRVFEYDDTTGIYKETSSYIGNGPFINDSGMEEIEYTYRRYEANFETSTLEYCLFDGIITTNPTTGEVSDFGMCFNGAWKAFYANDNITSINGNDGYGPTFEYHATQNPLFATQGNLKYLIAILKADFNAKIDLGYHSTRLLSANNLSRIQDDSDGGPESTIYEYEYNEFGLPTSVIRKTYYGTTLESQGHFAKYYYQGNQIPE